MKAAYIDTSVVIAKYKKNDPFYAAAKTLLEGRTVRCISAPITLVELAVVITRQRHVILVEDNMEDVKRALTGLSEEDQIHVLTQFIVLDNPIEYYSHLGSERLFYEAWEIEMVSDYATAIMFTPKLRLKCLDTLQIASLKNIILAKGEKVDYFVTNDQELLDRRREISKLIGVTSVDPETLLQLEG